MIKLGMQLDDREVFLRIQVLEPKILSNFSFLFNKPLLNHFKIISILCIIKQVLKRELIIDFWFFYYLR